MPMEGEDAGVTWSIRVPIVPFTDWVADGHISKLSEPS